MHHKRKRPRNRRGGCKLCKPWKVNGYRTERMDGEKFSDHRRRHAVTEEDITDFAKKKIDYSVIL
ncbi:MAG: hypothetical protein AAF569_02755 [Pseudomonadota bacterium]